MPQFICVKEINGTYHCFDEAQIVYIRGKDGHGATLKTQFGAAIVLSEEEAVRIISALTRPDDV